MSSSINVLVRVRPAGVCSTRCGKFESDGPNLAEMMARLKPKSELKVGKNDDTVRVNKRVFKFDRVFGQRDEQSDVFEGAAAPLVDAVCQGFNAAVIAYGQTGSGKTYTMLGEQNLWQMAEQSVKGENVDVPNISQLKSQGIIYRSLEKILQYAQHATSDPRIEIKCSCSYMEIYKEKIYDLLSADSSKRLHGERGLETRDDTENGGVSIPNLTEVSVSGMQQVVEILWRGAVNRAIDATDMNEYSSRSHTIFQITLEQHHRGSNKILKSKLNLVDLAGSEKWRTHRKLSEARIQEMTSINQSLSNLGNCIRKLLSPKQQHIPYRNSKLTRILQDSIGGNSRTAFVITLSPEAMHNEETVSSLQFAERAKKVVLVAKVNESNPATRTVSQLEAKVASLEKELSALRDQPAGEMIEEETKTDYRFGKQEETVFKVAQRLKAWQSNNQRERRIIEEDQVVQMYGDWLLDHLLCKDGTSCDLSKSERLHMAEWAVLLQARQLESLARKQS